MKIIPVPCRSDNYMYIIIDEVTKSTAVVDPYDPVKLEVAAKEHGIKLGEYLITTHHHEDHSGGNLQFIKNYPKVKVYGSNRTPGVTHPLKDRESFKIGEIEFKALATPCHTQDHICYFAEDTKQNQRGVFTGDTLFISGCGRFFEGTANEMNTALNETLASLPNDTTTYVGHEYTESNVAFSKSIDPTNPSILKLIDYIKKNKKEDKIVTTGKFTIGDEKEWNVFMRCNSAAVREKTGAEDNIEAMGALREMKNNFRG